MALRGTNTRSTRPGGNSPAAGGGPARPCRWVRARTRVRVRAGTGGPASDRGSASVEFLGFLPLLLLLALGAVYLGLTAFAAQQAGTGARAAARTATQDEPQGAPEGAGRAAMTAWVADRADVVAPRCASGGEITVTVTVDVPALIPGTDFSVSRRATMPCPDDPAPVPAVPAPAPAGAR
ncbi:TadE/TadG family type IV pilus assembly protein [Streptomyces cinnamoneus]|uniref:TadE/TadG family type IV pilus assembly protein n=1 Tax=Streptomyces cinnamoneus TaxID=53446 RepID=UPI0037AEC33B